MVLTNFIFCFKSLVLKIETSGLPNEVNQTERDTADSDEFHDFAELCFFVEFYDVVFGVFTNEF